MEGRECAAWVKEGWRGFCSGSTVFSSGCGHAPPRHNMSQKQESLAVALPIHAACSGSERACMPSHLRGHALAREGAARRMFRCRALQARLALNRCRHGVCCFILTREGTGRCWRQAARLSTVAGCCWRPCSSTAKASQQQHGVRCSRRGG